MATASLSSLLRRVRVRSSSINQEENEDDKENVLKEQISW
jgi:hypothetical protein